MLILKLLVYLKNFLLFDFLCLTTKKKKEDSIKRALFKKQKKLEKNRFNVKSDVILDKYQLAMLLSTRS